MAAAEPVDHHHEEVDAEEGQAVQVGKQSVGLDGGGSVIREGAGHPVHLPRLVVEGPDHPHAGDVLQQHGAQPVQQLLELSEQGRGAAHDAPGQQQDHGHHRQQDQAHPGVQAEGQRQGQDADHRYGDDHLQGAGEGHLDGGDVRDGAGGDGGGAELPEVVDGQLQALGVDGLPHVPAHLGGEGGAGIAPQNGAPARHQGDDRHLRAGAEDGVKRGAGGAVVQHLRHQGGDEQRPRHVHDQQDDGDGAQLPVRLQKTQDQVHGKIGSFSSKNKKRARLFA